MTQIVDGFDGLRDVFSEIAAQFAAIDYTEPLSGFHDVLEGVHQSYFEQRRGPSGDAWDEWVFRAVNGPEEHPTLEVSKRLRKSLRSGNEGHVKQVDSRTMVFGTSIEYAAIHNFGATITTGIPLVSRDGGTYLPAGTRLTIPQREFVGMANETLQEGLDLIVAHAVTELIA